MEHVLPRLRVPGIPDVELDLVLRDDVHPETVSESELEALCPVLPELVGELWQMMDRDSSE